MLSGIILITVPTIQYGGYFLVTSLMNRAADIRRAEPQSHVEWVNPSSYGVGVCHRGMEPRCPQRVPDRFPAPTIKVSLLKRPAKSATPFPVASVVKLAMIQTLFR